MLEIKNISKTFNPGTEEENTIFKDFSLKVEEGIATTIIGPNGCGKSTLMRIISGALPVDRGSILIDGEDVTGLSEEKRAAYIGKVSQDPKDGVATNLDIYENMALSLKKSGKFTLKSLNKNADEKEIIARLKSLNLGLEDKLHTKTGLLSGGQRQSLALLMATNIRPKLLLLDEHTAALDPKTSRNVMDKTRSLIDTEKITTLLISHNLRDVVRYSDRIIMLNKGQIALDVRAKDITEDELIRSYKEILGENN
ncbi:ABC transporter ATP-binding protein [Anaerococcus sp. Marseille-P3915]|uniref:ABC transporter ATP-binding protein n=1 Tax=Anaerococcus sp. Marseille-P3915 TaxID=2057799 RepID=UPI000D0AEE29|nr:ATP-binding cassette domain-containing protein [Anaerococcus sp. Marseille-P3915]